MPGIPALRPGVGNVTTVSSTQGESPFHAVPFFNWTVRATNIIGPFLRASVTILRSYSHIHIDRPKKKKKTRRRSLHFQTPQKITTL